MKSTTQHHHILTETATGSRKLTQTGFVGFLLLFVALMLGSLYLFATFVASHLSR